MPQSPTPRDYKKLEAIASLMKRGQLEEAEEAAFALTRERPKLVHAWEALGDIADQLGDNFTLWQVARQLCQLEPREDHFWFNRCVACMKLQKLFLTRQALNTYLQRFPNGAHRKEVLQMQGPVEDEVRRLAESGALPAGPDEEGLVMFETGELLISNGRTAEGRRYSLDAARRLPDYAPSMNNVSLSYVLEGDYPKALQALDTALAAQPENYFSRISRIELLLKLGRAEDARSSLDALVQEDPSMPDHWGKLIETCAMMHDHARVLEVYERATAAFKARSTPLPRYFPLVAGTAHAFLGQEQEARKVWKLLPNASEEKRTADKILADLPGHGPWYFSLSIWIPDPWQDRVSAIMERLNRHNYDRVSSNLMRFADQTPGMLPSVVLLLERGDPAAVDFALAVAALYPTLPGLVEFATGQRGTDGARLRAALIAAEHGLLPYTEPVTLMRNGKPAQVLLPELQVYYESTNPTLPPKAQKRLEAAYVALGAGNSTDALHEADAGLEIVPGDPTLTHFKINALRMMKRDSEADVLVRWLAEAAPDYLFARVEMSMLLTREKRFDEAMEWLKPLLARGKYHQSELRAVAVAYIRLLSAEGKQTEAGIWLDILEQYDPGGVRDALLRELAPNQLKSAMSKLLGMSR